MSNEKKFNVPHILKSGDVERWHEQQEKNKVILPPADDEDVDRLPNTLPTIIRPSTTSQDNNDE